MQNRKVLYHPLFQIFPHENVCEHVKPPSHRSANEELMDIWHFDARSMQAI